MAWINVPGLAGKVYVPEDVGLTQKKHPCKTCFSCQWCDDNRCQVCRDDPLEAHKPGSSTCCTRCLATSAKANRR